MYENNESAPQNADVAFQLRALGQQLEFLWRIYKDLKDEVNSINLIAVDIGVRKNDPDTYLDWEKKVD